MNTAKVSQMIKQPFYKTFVLYSNILNEFTVESLINVSLESAYRCGQNVLHDESVYGYIIVKIENNSWTVVNETVQGCDYTLYEHNGSVQVKEGRDSIVLV